MQRPRDVVIDVSRLSTDTSLSWTVRSGAAGYAVGWRPAVEPVSTRALAVGEAGTATIEGRGTPRPVDSCRLLSITRPPGRHRGDRLPYERT
jgi:hypothetical protein